MTVPAYPNASTYDPGAFGNPQGIGALRPNAVSVSADPSAENGTLPSQMSACVKGQMPALQVVRDLAAGNARVRARGETYLPKAPLEAYANYNDRLSRSVFTNLFGYTVKGLIGQIFRKDPILSTDVPAPIQTQWENIDLCGTHGDVFVRDLAADAETAGHAAILVEFPKTSGAQTGGQENP